MSAPGTDREPVERSERRRWLIALVLLSLIAVLLRLETLDIGLLSDDYMQHAMVAGLFPGDGYAPFDLYAFVRPDIELAAHVDQGTVPWFAEPDFHGAVLRPLSSALLWLDHTIAPGNVRLWHAHSLIELALLAGSLGGGEYGLGVVAYLFVWELFAKQDAWAQRARALIPAAVVATTYLALHSLLDYGTFGADVYADPLSHPLGWWKWAKFRIPALCTSALWSISASSVMVFEHPGAAWWQALWPANNPYEVYHSHLRISLVGMALAALGLWLARAGLHAGERRTMRTLLLGAFLGLLPVSVAPSHERLLILAQLGACATISLLVFACVRLLRQSSIQARARGAALLPMVAALLLLNTYFDLRWSERYLLHLDGLAAADEMAFTEGNLLEQELADRDVLVLNGPSQTVGMYGPFALDILGQSVPASWRPLALGGEHPMFAYRPNKNTLELTAIQGAWLMTAGELFFRRAEQLLPAGTKLEYPGMDVQILADSDGHPTKVRFTFPRSLDDPRYLFLVSTPHGLDRWPVPKVSGSTVVPLPRVPFPEHLIPLDSLK